MNNNPFTFIKSEIDPFIISYLAKSNLVLTPTEIHTKHGVIMGNRWTNPNKDNEDNKGDKQISDNLKHLMDKAKYTRKITPEIFKEIKNLSDEERKIFFNFTETLDTPKDNYNNLSEKEKFIQNKAKRAIAQMDKEDYVEMASKIFDKVRNGYSVKPEEIASLTARDKRLMGNLIERETISQNKIKVTDNIAKIIKNIRSGYSIEPKDLQNLNDEEKKHTSKFIKKFSDKMNKVFGKKWY